MNHGWRELLGARPDHEETAVRTYIVARIPPVEGVGGFEKHSFFPENQGRRCLYRDDEDLVSAFEVEPPSSTWVEGSFVPGINPPL